MNVMTSLLTSTNHKEVPFKKGSMLKRAHTRIHTEQNSSMEKSMLIKTGRSAAGWHNNSKFITRIFVQKSNNNNNNHYNDDDDNDFNDDINEQMYENWPILWSVEQGMLNHKQVAPSIQTYAANWIMCVCVWRTRDGKCYGCMRDIESIE